MWEDPTYTEYLTVLKLQAATLWEHLQSEWPGRWSEHQHRTLRRHVRAWRKEQAIATREAIADIPQDPPPGEQSQSDWTHMESIPVTVGGVEYPHLLYHFSLPHSSWQWVRDTRSESFASLAEGLTAALTELGGVPRMHQTDGTTAATHRVAGGGRAYNPDYIKLTDHYDLYRRRYVGKPKRNGSVESLNGAFKSKLEQRLRLRGSFDFADRQAYRDFLEALCRELNGRRGARLEADLAALRELPPHPYPTYRVRIRTVTQFSYVNLDANRYSVPSRLVGQQLELHVHADRVTFLSGSEVVAEHELLHGRGGQWSVRVGDVIGSLMQKPGGFARCAYRDCLIPNLTFRRVFDQLFERHQERRAALEYLRILQLSLTQPETVRSELDRRLANGIEIDYASVRDELEPRVQKPPAVQVDAPDLSAYDALLNAVEESS